MSKYGSRDDYELGGPETTLGPDSIAKPKDVAKKGADVLNRAMRGAHPDYNKHEKKLISKMSNAEKADKGWRNPNVDEGLDKLYPFERTVIDYMQDNSWLSAERAYFRYIGLQKKKQMSRSAWEEEIQRFIDLYNKHKGQQGVEEGLADDFMKMAQAKGYNVRRAGTPDQERERTQQTLAQRAADRENRPAQQVSDEQRAQLQAKLKELEAQFDPNYQYSDDYSFWNRQHAISQQISAIRKQLGLTEVSKKTLGDYLHGAHKDVVDRASSGSFQSGQAGDKYNKADVSSKERQREKGMARAISRLTRGGSSMAEAWASRYPNINADISECQSSGDTNRLKKLMAISTTLSSSGLHRMN